MLDFIKAVWAIFLTVLKGGRGVSFKLTSPEGVVSYIGGTQHLGARGVPMRYLLNGLKSGFRLAFESNLSPDWQMRVYRSAGEPRHSRELLEDHALLAEYNGAFAAMMAAIMRIGGVSIDLMLARLDKSYTTLEDFKGSVAAMQAVMAANVKTATSVVNTSVEAGVASVVRCGELLAAGDLEGVGEWAASFPQTAEARESLVTRNYRQAHSIIDATAERGGISAYVGVLHLHGEHAVQEILAREGWKVERQ